eukprot:5094991-Amphidinium_carterae.4
MARGWVENMTTVKTDIEDCWSWGDLGKALFDTAIAKVAAESVQDVMIAELHSLISSGKAVAEVALCGVLGRLHMKLDGLCGSQSLEGKRELMLKYRHEGTNGCEELKGRSELALANGAPRGWCTGCSACAASRGECFVVRCANEAASIQAWCFPEVYRPGG